MSTVKHNVINELNVDKELFTQMVKEAGFKSMRQFAAKVGISSANLSDRVNGRYAVSIPMMYSLANVLGCAIDDMVKVFYPVLWKKNQCIAKQARLDRNCDEIEIKIL